jgi:uncharacterized sulfatase
MLIRNISLIALSILLVSCGADETSVDKKPNVLFIISDDQKWDDFSFMGHDIVDTPNIDTLASQSAVFENGYVPSSLCRPSLATITTGQYPHTHGITSNDPPEGVHRAQMIRFIARTHSLPRLLRRAGYTSFQSGKWWEAHYSSGGFTHGMTINNDNGRHGDRGLRIGRETMKPIKQFIDNNQSNPFFLWYAPFLPHTPHNPPEEILSKYKKYDIDDDVASYYAMIEWFDQTVGNLVNHLEKRNLKENTIIFFVIDNGWIENVNREEGEFAFAPKSKRSPYDGGVRTPIMVRWPGHVEPGRRKELVSTIDFVPTVLDAVGLSVPEELPGKDLVSIAEGQSEREAIFGEIFTHDAVDLSRPEASLKYRWVREDEWKLIVSDSLDTMELYNIKKDPEEETNLINERPKIAEELITRINTWWGPNVDLSMVDDTTFYGVQK